MNRAADSHKGENGKTAIVGGSLSMHGAPLFSALAAEASGVDLLYVSVPRCHAEIAKQQSLNFQVHPFAGDDIEKGDIDALLQMLATVDSAVIGPGLSRTEHSQSVIRELIEGAPCPIVLDASALQSWTLQAVQGKQAILTPHLGELERVGIAPGDIENVSASHGIAIHLKGPIDRIVLPDGIVHTVEGGSAGLTVGGTGDALAGLIAGLLAQGWSAADACVTASKTIKKAGEILEKKCGYAYGTRRVIDMIAGVMIDL